MIDFGSDATEDVNAELDEQRQVVDFVIDEMRKIIEGANIVIFKFEARPMTLPEAFKIARLHPK